jgi:hypothetical protein
MKQEDPLYVFFDDDARSVLFSLVDNLIPETVSYDDSNDLFSPTISAVFKLFDQLMILNTPDLYLTEWQVLAKAVSQSKKGVTYNRLLGDTSSLQQRLVIMLEDLSNSSIEGIDSFELSKKIAGFNSVVTTAISYHIQRSLVAKRRGKVYKFPEIKFKG